MPYAADVGAAGMRTYFAVRGRAISLARPPWIENAIDSHYAGIP